MVVVAGTIAALPVYRYWRRRSIARAVLAQTRRCPGVLVSRLSFLLNVNERELRQIVRQLEGEGRVISLPERGDRRLWSTRRT